MNRASSSRISCSRWIRLALVCLAIEAPLSHAETADRIIAVVGDRVVTASDVAMEAAMAPFLDCPEFVLCEESTPIEDRLIDMAIIRSAAGDARAYQPSENDVQVRLAHLRAAWNSTGGYASFLLNFGLTEDELAAILYSRMVAERYVQRTIRLPLVAAGGTPEEVSARYTEWIYNQRRLFRVRRMSALEQR